MASLAGRQPMAGNGGQWAGIAYGGKYRMLGLRGNRFGPCSRRPGITLVIALSVVAGAASFAALGPMSGAAAPAACRHRPASGTSVVSGTPGAVAAGVASALFGCAPTVVVANADRMADVAVAVAA